MRNRLWPGGIRYAPPARVRITSPPTPGRAPAASAATETATGRSWRASRRKRPHIHRNGAVGAGGAIPGSDDARPASLIAPKMDAAIPPGIAVPVLPADPNGGENERYWNGVAWTEHRRSGDQPRTNLRGRSRTRRKMWTRCPGRCLTDGTRQDRFEEGVGSQDTDAPTADRPETDLPEEVALTSTDKAVSGEITPIAVESDTGPPISEPSHAIRGVTASAPEDFRHASVCSSGDSRTCVHRFGTF